jgi:alkylation response protein AidB-like acyl-CoA dehydrogenase
MTSASTFARSAASLTTRCYGRALAQAGVLGTAVGAPAGGSGLGLTELALVLEEQGRTLAALPLLPTLVLGALAAGEASAAPAQQALLPALVARGSCC